MAKNPLDTVTTVVILGAGSSYPYNYPLGKGLFEKLELLDAELSHSTVLNTSRMKQEPGKHFSDIYQTYLRSKCSTIDEFVTYRPEFQEDLKYLTARAIRKCENSDCEGFKGIGDDWIQILINKRFRNRSEIKSGKIGFISFNYDLSLEYFLSSAFHARFKITNDEIVDYMSNVPIFHPRGIVGKLSFDSVPERRNFPIIKYGDQSEIEYLDYEHSKKLGLLGVSSVDKDNLEVRMSQALINKAKHIYFLGFGFHDDNMKLLGLGKDKPSSLERCYSTTVGLDDGTFDKIKSGFPWISRFSGEANCSRVLTEMFNQVDAG